MWKEFLLGFCKKKFVEELNNCFTRECERKINKLPQKSGRNNLFNKKMWKKIQIIIICSTIKCGR